MYHSDLLTDARMASALRAMLPLTVMTESDDETLDAHAVSIGAITFTRYSKPAGSQRVFLGTELRLQAHQLQYRSPQMDRELHSHLRTLSQTSRTSNGVSACVSIGEREAPVMLPQPALEASRSAIIGRHGTQIRIHAAFWQADSITAHSQRASIELRNGHKTVAEIEHRMLSAIVEGLYDGKAGLMLRLGDQPQGEWAQAKPTWPHTHELTVMAQLTSSNGQADGTDLHKRTWQQRVARTASRVSAALAVQIEQCRVHERQQTRYARIRETVAHQCGDLIDEWLTDAGDGVFRARAISTIVAVQARGEASWSSYELDTVKDWVRCKIRSMLANET
jgi:hypothetical protein